MLVYKKLPPQIVSGTMSHLDKSLRTCAGPGGANFFLSGTMTGFHSAAFVQPIFQQQRRGQQKPGGANPRKRYP
jgi:hypothetical protein